jgi:hypothetical protein
MRAPVSNTRGGGQQLESDTQALTQETTSNQGGGDGLRVDSKE